MIPHLGVHRLASAQRRVRTANPDRPVIRLQRWRVLGLAGLTCLGAAVITTASATAALPKALTSPPTVTIGKGPVVMALGATTHDSYAANRTSPSVSIPHAEHCSARVNGACGKDISMIAPGAGADPRAAAVDTVYVANDGGGVPMHNGSTTIRPARQTSGTQACRPSALPYATPRTHSQHLELTANCPATWRHRPSPSAAHRRTSW